MSRIISPLRLPPEVPTQVMTSRSSVSVLRGRRMIS
jgi:hypothetical protein